jgi:hypothetical protein
MAPVAAVFPIIPPVDTLLTTSPTTTASKDKQENIHKRFEAVYAVIRDHLLADFRKYSMPEEAIEYYQKVRTIVVATASRMSFLL